MVILLPYLFVFPFSATCPSLPPAWVVSMGILTLSFAGGLFLDVYLRRRQLVLPPGPFSWPVVGSWFQVGDDLNHRKLAELARKYGEIVFLQMGQRRIVVVSSPELAKEVLLTRDLEFSSRSGTFVNDIFTGAGQDIVFSAYGAHWRQMRRILTLPLCTTKVVQEWRLDWEDEINKAVDSITFRRESFTSGIVLWKRLQLMVYNIMYRMMFNRRFDNEDDPLFAKLVAYNAERSQLEQSFDHNYGDFMPILQPFLKGYLNQCKQLQKNRMEFLKYFFLDERKELWNLQKVQNDTRSCAIDRMFKDQMNQEIDENNVLFIIESLNVQAIETTLCSIEWVLAEIINRQEIQDKLRSELDRILDGAQMSEPDVSRMPYLQAVVKESLRLHVPIPLLMPRKNEKQSKLGKYDIPPETRVLVNAWWIANNPSSWDRPEHFIPERFLQEQIEANGSDFSFLPFGSGRRCCPGTILALPLLSLVVGRLVQTYELLPGPGLDRMDMAEVGGQSRLHLLNHSLVRVRVRA